MQNKIVLSLFFTGIVATSLSAASIDVHLEKLESLSPTLLERLDSLNGPIEEIPERILQEAVLISYSRWNLSWDGRDFPLSVFEMLDSQAAFGLFTRTQGLASGATRLELDVDSLLTDQDTLHFRKGHFFLRLHLPPQASVEDAASLASLLLEAIDETSLYPMSVVQLPTQDLIRDSIRFYLGPEGLRENPDFPAPLRDQLGFKDFAEVAMGRYGENQQPLFLIGYPTASVAEDYFARIQNALQSYFSTEGVYIKRSGLLISLFPGPEEAARVLLDRVQYTATVRWIYEKDTLIEDALERRGEVVTFLGVVSRSFIFTGAFILIVLGAGILAGMLRFWLLGKYPALQHRDDTVQLQLGAGPTKLP